MGDEDDSKVYVGSLDFNTDKDKLKGHFESYFGEQTVSDAIVIEDRDTGRSRGFGFVTFVDSTWVEKAISLNNTVLDGRTIKVSKANSRGGGRGFSRGGRGYRGGGGYGGGGYGGSGGYGGGGGYGGSGGQNYGGDRWGGGGGGAYGGSYQQNTGGYSGWGYQ